MRADGSGPRDDVRVYAVAVRARAWRDCEVRGVATQTRVKVSLSRTHPLFFSGCAPARRPPHATAHATLETVLLYVCRVHVPSARSSELQLAVVPDTLASQMLVQPPRALVKGSSG